MAENNDTPEQLELPFSEVVKIPLTKGYFAIVDIEDSDLLKQKWHACFDAKYQGGGAYKARGHIKIKNGRLSPLMHRVILSRMLGRPLNADETVDHINHDTLDNRRSNLRLASLSENTKHRHKRKDNTSGVVGVHFSANHNKWIATISINKREVYLGIFTTFDEAVHIRKQAENEYYGEFKPV